MLNNQLTPQPMHTDQRLAIVIPAYKSSFFDETLRSLASQTCKDFTVYVGDDASPNDLKIICERWSGMIDLRYHRFEQNLGATDLVGQWTRCMALSSEPWLWLFSDDDLLDTECVAAFYTQLDSNEVKHDLYHFNVDVIDGAGVLIKEASPFPSVLSAPEFAQRRFTHELSSFAPDYVFSRDTFLAKGGFQAFPRAWCSDDATWIKLAGESGICTIIGPKVKWRLSGQNISSIHTHDRFEKLEAAIQYLEWLDQYSKRKDWTGSEFSSQSVLMTGRWWLYAQAEGMRIFFSLAGFWSVTGRLNKIYGGPLVMDALRIFLQDLRVLRRRLLGH